MAPRFKDVCGVSAPDLQIRSHGLSHILRKREDALSIGLRATDFQTSAPPIDICECDVRDLFSAVRDARKPAGAPGHEGCGAFGPQWLTKAPAPVPVRVPEAEKCVCEWQLPVTRPPSPKEGG